jgi:O-antigen/teichoic acid export membrane protein
MHQQIKKLMLGNGLAQLLQFGSILILSRIYQPSDFANLAQVQSIAIIASIIITLQLHLTIPLAKSTKHAQEKVQLIQILSVCIFLLGLPPAIVYGQSAIFACILSFLLGLANTYISFLVYKGSFGKVSILYVTRAIIIIVMQIFFFYAEFRNGLVIATLAGEAIFTLFLGLKTNNNIQVYNFEYRKLKSIVIKNKSFSLYGTIQEVVSVAAFYAPLILFNIKYGEDIGGQYAMASRIIWAPIVLISSSFSQVLSHTYGRNYQHQPLELTSHLNQKILTVLVVVSSLGFLLDEIYFIALGGEWELASKLIPLQISWGLIFILSTPFRVASRVMRLQKYQLLTDATALLAFAIILLSFDMTPIESMWVIVAVAVVQHALLSIIVLKKYRILQKYGK